jgi:Flp pilus assembly protein TadG
MKYYLNSLLGQFHRNEHGNATIEFVVLFPVLFAMIVAMFDSSLLMMKYVVLENSLDQVVRTVRLSGIAGGEAGATYFKQQVCAKAKLISNCEANLYVEMIPISTGSTFTPPPVTCIDRTANNPPANTITVGTPNDIVYIRACVVVDRYFPSALSGIFNVDSSGGIRLIADSAYVVEPS